jgi:hypothetical protein
MDAIVTTLRLPIFSTILVLIGMNGMHDPREMLVPIPGKWIEVSLEAFL